jgi:hypothetical protein
MSLRANYRNKAVIRTATEHTVLQHFCNVHMMRVSSSSGRSWRVEKEHPTTIPGLPTMQLALLRYAVKCRPRLYKST